MILRREDILLAYTDHLTEARNDEHALFGIARVIEQSLAHGVCAPEELLARDCWGRFREMAARWSARMDGPIHIGYSDRGQRDSP